MYKVSTLEAFFDVCKANPEATKNLLYVNVPEQYRWDQAENAWIERKRKIRRTALGRMYFANPRDVELSCLRRLLCEVPGPTSYEALRTVNGVLCNTFKEACLERGFIADDREPQLTLKEAKETITNASQFSALFAQVLVFQDPARPHVLYEEFKDELVADYLYAARQAAHNDLLAPTEAMYNQGLLRLEKHLHGIASSLSKYPGMPQPVQENNIAETRQEREARVAIEEVAVWPEDRAQAYYDEWLPKLNEEQQRFVQCMVNEIDEIGLFYRLRRPYFLDGPGGTGKSLVYNVVLAYARSKGKIAIATASSGIAATILEGGTTAHSRFRIPITNLDADSTCSTDVNSDSAALLAKSSIIIVDEAPMMSRYAWEAVNKLLKDIMRIEDPRLADTHFGGKLIVFGGDFKQCLPVVVRGSRAEIVQSSLASSTTIWDAIHVFKLTKNMRVHKMLAEGASPQVVQRAKQFAALLLKVGKGNVTTFKVGTEDSHIALDNRLNLLEQKQSQDQRFAQLFQAVFGDLAANMDDSDYLTMRAVLAAKNVDVDAFNKYALSKITGQLYVALSTDTLSNEEDGDRFPPEYIHSLNPPSLPPHELRLKVSMCTQTWLHACFE